MYASGAIVWNVRVCQKFITSMQNFHGFLWIKKTFGSMKIAEDVLKITEDSVKFIIYLP